MLSAIRNGFGGIASLLLLIGASTAMAAEVDCVVLLHGLARTSSSMMGVESELERANFRVVNLNYPSREDQVSKLAQDAVTTGIENCENLGARKVHFVTHSLGGILVRVYFQDRTYARLGRVVMLGPPNQGSELVDALESMPGFTLLNGPSGAELGTEPDDIVSTLGPVNFELGIIAGSQSLNPLYGLIIPGPDDGKVSIDSTKVEGMREHVVLPVSHTWMMFNEEVIEYIIGFLNTGSFMREPE